MGFNCAFNVWTAQFQSLQCTQLLLHTGFNILTAILTYCSFINSNLTKPLVVHNYYTLAIKTCLKVWQYTRDHLGKSACIMSLTTAYRFNLIVCISSETLLYILGKNFLTFKNSEEDKRGNQNSPSTSVHEHRVSILLKSTTSPSQCLILLFLNYGQVC